MKQVPVVIDTNVLISALRSRRGPSYRLFERIDSAAIKVCISVPLFLEYEAAAKRLVRRGGLGLTEVNAILTYVASIAEPRRIFYLWRPCLADPKDDMVLELAVAGRCQYIVTYNQRDFRGAERFGLRLLTPKELLKKMGELE